MHIQPRLLALSALLLSTVFALPALAASTAIPAALEMPGEVTLGPDQFEWVTGRVSDIDLDTEKKSVALAIDEVFAGKENEGLLGFALHPQLGMGKGHDFVYVASTYDSGTSGAVKDRRSRIVQYYWDAEAGTLGDPVDLLPAAAAVVGSVVHN
ncbi:MAG TPA: hypothetical protein VM144_10560 [Aestuariivirga sp.]|nr:hypothetical protein [Aestuariivirga sp.]